MALPPVPFRNALARLPGLFITEEWTRWLTAVVNAIGAAAQKVGTVGLTTQGAAIASTPIPTPALGSGLYRVSVYARITQAATTSSALTVTVDWTDGGVACSQLLAFLTGNTPSTTQSASLVIRADEGTTIRYSTGYSSTGATAMQYALDVRAEAIP
jgi:hypothetical protein